MEKRFAIGIDIGGTSIKYGICSSRGEILYQESERTKADALPEDILQQLIEICHRTLDQAQSQRTTITAVGIGTPGCVDIEKGYLIGSTPNFKHWRDVSIGTAMAEAIQQPVFVDNDANMMAYGEYCFGAGQGKRDIVCLTLGTGIGGGIIIGGEIYRGSFYSGSELGHMTIDYDGRKCNCGGSGCFERYGSATALVEDFNREQRGAPAENTRQIFEQMDRGDKTAHRVIDRYIAYLGAGLASIVNIFNPERIILGGGVSDAGEWLIERIRRETSKRAMVSSMRQVNILKAQLGNRAGLLGAAAFALLRKEQTGQAGE